MINIRTNWRIIVSVPAAGAWNMAVDEAILEAAGNGLVPPTLRLYAWLPACLSLGVSQPYLDVDQESLLAHGWHVVRRPTGGRAILHADELTYSICGPLTEPCLAGGVLESYRIISGALLETLASLGIPAESNQTTSPRKHSTNHRFRVPENTPDPVCFTEPSNYEITHDGKKLIGSAQARRSNAVLQHGSLPLTGDLQRIVYALKHRDEQARVSAASRIRERASTLEQAAGRNISWEEAAFCMQQAFEKVLRLNLIEGELTVGETSRAAELVSQKYANSSWTERI